MSASASTNNVRKRINMYIHKHVNNNKLCNNYCKNVCFVSVHDTITTSFIAGRPIKLIQMAKAGSQSTRKVTSTVYGHSTPWGSLLYAPSVNNYPYLMLPHAELHTCTNTSLTEGFHCYSFLHFYEF